MVSLTLAAALVVSGWAAPPKAARVPEGPLALEVMPEPAVAHVGQEISLKIRWLNRSAAGGTALRVNRRCLLGREVVIAVRAKGKPELVLVTPADLGPPVETDFRMLEPGEAFEYEYPLTLKSGRALPPGNYDVRVVYRNDIAGGDPPAWTGSLQARAKLRVRPL